jgi:very-short-patch-repair endonuclease
MKYDEIVKRAKIVHGNKYDYPKFSNISVLKKMKIICPIHGEFEQVVYAHLRGQGCPKCIGKRRNYTTENFIKDATEKFGDKFDYSKTVYTNRREKVCIMCKELITEENPTGEFWQYPFVHLKSKTGMPFLGRRGIKYPEIIDEDKIKEQTKQFISKAKKIHGDKYDYSKVEYKGAKIKVCIICPEHGEFYQMPENHLRGCGCQKCAKKDKINVDEFIEKAKKIHGDEYDYSLIDKISENKKIKIICKKHGEFEQYYHHHLQGCGCPICSNNKKSTTEEFIKKAKEIHGDKYDYSKVEYVNNHTPVCIICPKHGEFWQMPTNHILSKSNCPLCNESKLEEEINLLLNENTIENIRQKKFNNVKNINPLPFDFYLPKYNVVIECQGIQHFEKSPFFKDVNRIEKDVIKYNGCVDNGIKILYYTNVKGYTKYFNKIYNKNNLFVDKNKLLKEIKKSR